MLLLTAVSQKLLHVENILSGMEYVAFVQQMLIKSMDDAKCVHKELLLTEPNALII